MIIELDMSSSTPIYVQLRNQIVKGTVKGATIKTDSIDLATHKHGGVTSGVDKTDVAE